MKLFVVALVALVFTRTKVSAWTFNMCRGCPAPEAPNHGSVECEHDHPDGVYELGDVCEYRCDEGFELEPDAPTTTICQEIILSPEDLPNLQIPILRFPEPPCCVPAPSEPEGCNPPLDLTDGFYTCDDVQDPITNLYEVGTRCTYECDEGFLLREHHGGIVTECGEFQFGPFEDQLGFLFQPFPPCCSPLCQPAIDVLLILDASSSINRTEWQQTKDFALEIVGLLSVEGEDASQVALLTYNENILDIAGFGDFTSDKDLEDFISGLTRTGSGTWTGTALRTGRELLPINNNPNNPDVVILITDGRPTFSKDPVDPFKEGEAIRTSTDEFVNIDGVAIRGSGAILYGVGVGIEKAEDEQVIRDIIGPDSSHYIPVGGFDELSEAIAAQLRSVECDPDYCDINFPPILT